MIATIRKFLEMIRFSHTIFALPFALLSATLAWTKPDSFHWLDLLGIVLCMIFARSTAMAFNRLADRHLDANNPRTAGRHLPAGQLGVMAVWSFTLICALAFILSTLLFSLSGNPWPLWLSGPVLLFVCSYSCTKRFTFLCHVWLGASLCLAPVAAWIAIRGMEALPTPCLLGLAVLFWVTGFDILYSCQDVDFDRRAKLSSIPARFGVATSLQLAKLAHLLMLICLLALYWVAAPHLRVIYLTGIGLIAVLLVYEHCLVRPDDLGRVNRAFFNVNGVISVGLLLVVLLQIAFGI